MLKKEICIKVLHCCIEFFIFRDSAGRAKFAAISELFYVGTMAAIYCFDLTNKESFQHVENWMQKLTKSQHSWVFLHNKL